MFSSPRFRFIRMSNGHRKCNKPTNQCISRLVSFQVISKGQILDSKSHSKVTKRLPKINWGYQFCIS